MLAEATAALTRLDAARLELIAAKLGALAPGAVMGTAEIAARQRVFASVLRATGNNLAVLRRVAGEVNLWEL